MSEKIAFIICTNDEQELQECLFYLNQLQVPAGFEIELFAVEKASSMTSGYNQAMNASDAKYKIYLHQDVFILNRGFLSDVIAIFKENPDIGLLGCIGGRKLPEDANAITAWDTGRLLHNCVPNETIGYQDKDGKPVEVEAVDGCLIATQYDIPWREDLFDGWDFYDISQCFEFKRQGKIVAIPYQSANWIYHDNGHAKMTNYDHYRKIFAEEYEEYRFRFAEKKMITGEYYALRERVVSLVRDLFYRGEMESVCAVFADPVNQGNLALKEYELLARIYRSEDLQSEKSIFFETDMPEVMSKLRSLKHLLKRIEFNAGNREENIKSLLQLFSEIAIKETIMAYCVEKKGTWQIIRDTAESCWG